MGPQGRLVAARMNRHHAKLTAWGLSKVTVRSDFAVLDVGCGGGRTISRLAKLATQGKVYGLDYSSEMVKFSRKINKNLIAQNRVEVIEGTVEKVSFKDDCLDLVTAIETYYFWTKFNDALKEILRVLKPGGKLLLANELMFGVTTAKVVEETHVKLLPLTEIQNVLYSAGFREVQLFTLADSPWNAIVAEKPLKAA